MGDGLEIWDGFGFAVFGFAFGGLDAVVSGEGVKEGGEGVAADGAELGLREGFGFEKVGGFGGVMGRNPGLRSDCGIGRQDSIGRVADSSTARLRRFGRNDRVLLGGWR